MANLKSEYIKQKIYSTIETTREFYHFAPIDAQLGEKCFSTNLTLMTLTYLLDKNHLIIGEPGWGKTTVAKIIAAKFSGLPYDLYDALEMRGNPQKYEEKLIARPHYGQMHKGIESVVWQGTFGLSAIIVDEINRLPYETQDVILQGIETGRWNYLNESLFEGKKPTFATMNYRPEENNGLLPALNDRFDIMTEERYYSTFDVFNYSEARRRIRNDLCMQGFTQKALDALKDGFSRFKEVIESKPLKDHLTNDEKLSIIKEIEEMSISNDAWLFLQAFMAEINYSEKYGTKRANEPKSDDNHDMNYAGVNVLHSFSPRSAMSAIDYSKALAWFLGESEVTLDHVRFVLPYVFAPKAKFHPDYKNKHGNDYRQDCEMIYLAKTLVTDVHGRYVKCVQPLKNLIAKIQKGELSKAELKKIETSKEYDHPLMKDMINMAKGGAEPFYEDILRKKR